MLPDWPPASEAESSRNGILSHAAEWHAFILGIAAGLDDRDAVLDLVFDARPPVSDGDRDVVAQPWYAAAGYLLGQALRVVRGR